MDIFMLSEVNEYEISNEHVNRDLFVDELPTLLIHCQIIIE